jgi:hypothetical protein
MYCTHCGHQNATGTKFCESCGKPLIVTQVATQASSPSAPVTSTDWSRWLRRLPSIGAAIVVWGFFLPWVLVSCSVNFGSSDSGIKASGYEIASGNYATLNQIQQYSSMLGNTGGVNSQETGSPLVWLILVLGLVGLLALNGKAMGSIAAILAGILGIVGMAIVTFYMSTLGGELSRQGLKLQFQGGFWATWLGFIWLALSAMMTVKQKH